MGKTEETLIKISQNMRLNLFNFPNIRPESLVEGGRISSSFLRDHKLSGHWSRMEDRR